MSAPLSWSHRTTAISDIGLQQRVAASAAERSAIAKELGLLSCEAVEADYMVSPLGSGRYRLAVRLKARLTQACVATLEPLSQTMDEEFEVEFWPADSLPETGTAEVEALSVPEVEPIEHGAIEVGRVIFETLSAGLEPYPRKSGASLEWRDPESAEDAGPAGPFGVLKKLKDEG